MRPTRHTPTQGLTLGPGSRMILAVLPWILLLALSATAVHARHAVSERDGAPLIVGIERAADDGSSRPHGRGDHCPSPEWMAPHGGDPGDGATIPVDLALEHVSADACEDLPASARTLPVRAGPDSQALLQRFTI